MPETKIPADRLFVVRVTGDKGEFLGYAVTQRIAFIPAEAPRSAGVNRLIDELFEQAASEKKSKPRPADATVAAGGQKNATGTLSAIAFPAESDPRGPGILMFASGHPDFD